MRVIIVNFHGLRPDIRILVTSLIRVLYLPSLALCNLMLFLCYFALLCDLVLLLYCFADLCLMGYGCHAQFLDFLVHLVQRVLCYEHWSMSHVDQSLYRLKCLECLKCLKHLKRLQHPEHPKRFEYLEYFQSRLVYLTFRLLNPDFCLACLEVFLGHA